MKTLKYNNIVYYPIKRRTIMEHGRCRICKKEEFSIEWYTSENLLYLCRDCVTKLISLETNQLKQGVFLPENLTKGGE